MKRLFTIIILSFVMVSFTGFSSNAAVKKIRPDQLKVNLSSDEYYQTPYYVGSADDTDCFWSAVVKLPVGKKITKLLYYHKGSGGITLETEVKLSRFKMGELPQLMAGINSTNPSGTIIPVETTEITYPRIKTGYTYYVDVKSDRHEYQICGIKIFYKD